MKIKVALCLIPIIGLYLFLIASIFAAPPKKGLGTQAGRVYYGSRGEIYYRDPIQTPRWKPGYDVKIRTQVVTPQGGGSIILNHTYSK